MKRAGDVRKAADLVELYGTYGYDHFIPAPVKYKWNCIALLICLLALVMGFKRCCRKFCRIKKAKFKEN